MQKFLILSTETTLPVPKSVAPHGGGRGVAAGLNGRGLPPFIFKTVLTLLPLPAQLRSEQENENHYWQPVQD